MASEQKLTVEEVHILWISEGMSCDGDSVAMTAATQPSLEDVVLGLVPGIPKVHLHNKVLSPESGDELVAPFEAAAAGELGPYIFVVEGSIANEEIHAEGYFTGFGYDHTTGQPITFSTWIERLAPRALAVVAAGTCATYGGVHAMAGNPTGSMGLADFLGREFRSAAGIPIVNVPGCPIHPDNFMETLLWLLKQVAGGAPMIPLDDALRPTWLFGKTVHEGCDRAGYYEQGDFAGDYNSPKCQVRVGCWGPVVNCNVPKRGWLNGVGGCPNVGGICIGCTMPGFPDKFMPFMDEPPGGSFSSLLTGKTYGPMIRFMRSITNGSLNKEPRWRCRGPALSSGYDPTFTPSSGQGARHDERSERAGSD